MPTDRDHPRPSSSEPWQPLPTTATWNDLVAAPPVLAQLRQIAAAANVRFRDFTPTRRRGGIAALFAGQRGTGKTLAAEVLANALELELWRVDLSRIMSKYIGETEKNLSRVFEAAEQGDAILLFDEADALFGRRSEVKDSDDRYVNLEVGYLLQRIENHAGLVILTTNLQHALDPAFTRRLRYIVDFPLPNAAEREAIWRRILPADTSVEKVDFSRLARIELPGGAIRNIARRAGQRASVAGVPVTMLLLLEASLIELRKLGRPMPDTDD